MALVRVARRTTSGRNQRLRSAAGRTRKPDLGEYYSRSHAPVRGGDFRFELTLLRGRGNKSIPLDPYLEQFQWTDTDEAMSGSLQLRRPGTNRANLPIGRGHRVRCRVRWGGDWYVLWTMRCDAPEVTVAADGIRLSVALQDDMDLVRRGRRRYVRRTRKRRAYGYFGHEVLREFAAREGIVLGQLAKCTKRMSKVDVTGSFLDLAVEVYAHERKKTGRRFVARMRDGKFEVVPYRRNRLLYVLGKEIRNASVTQQPKAEKPPTVLVGKGRVGSGKNARKVKHTELRRDMVERFGYTVRERDYGRVDSAAEMRQEMRRDLAAYYRVDTIADVEHQGIPFIRRGDGAQLLLPSEGFTGARSFVYCTGVSHQVQGASYTATYSFSRVDPFLADQQARDKATRAAARKKRKQGKAASSR